MIHWKGKSLGKIPRNRIVGQNNIYFDISD